MTNTEDKKTNNLIEQMFKVGAHFGYSKTKRHPSTKPFIFGVKGRVEIFDLEKTSASLEDAKNFVASLAAEGKQILFVSSKSEAKEVIKNGAESIDMPFVAGRWVGGTISNFSEIKKRVQRFVRLSDDKEKGLLGKYTKKERLLIDREIDKLASKFSGLVSMTGFPAALFVVDPKKEEIAVKEATEKKIPVISLANSDCNIKNIDFPIPANDSSKSSIEFFVNQIVDAYKEGKKSAPAKTSESRNKESK